MPNFQEAVTAAARRELARFGGLKETSKDARNLLVEYWLAVPGMNEKSALVEIGRRTAWSAAFISFVVRDALQASGSKAFFDRSASHSVYAGAAIRNDFDQVKPPAFLGFPPRGNGAEKPKPGDIIGVTRTRSIDDYEDALKAARAQPKPQTYFSHFDVVVSSNGVQMEVIGGNVSDSVTLKTVQLDKDGFPPIRPFTFDKAGQVLSGPYICLIRHMP